MEQVWVKENHTDVNLFIQKKERERERERERESYCYCYILLQQWINN